MNDIQISIVLLSIMATVCVLMVQGCRFIDTHCRWCGRELSEGDVAICPQCHE